MGVEASNNFLFPRPTRGSLNALRGWDAVHEIASKASLKRPDLVTSTKETNGDCPSAIGYERG